MNAQITIYTSGKTTQTRIYAGDFERLTQNGTTTSYQYIYSPDGLVGIYVKPSNGTAEMHYAVTDHLGSLLALYKSNFTQTYAATYDAWGKQTISKNALNLRRGYCLHEHWNELDLIDMNGRFYDPVLGRFLSPDPYVQDITNPQNFNRYSYCLNNPLKYTDPSGEMFWLIPTIGWSKSGGLSFGISAVFGIPGEWSVQAGVSFSKNNFCGFVGATAAMTTAYISASTQGGLSVGLTTGFSPYSGTIVSTNFCTAGIGYNFKSESGYANISAWNSTANGMEFDPSVSVMVFPERTTNLVRGKGFHDNDYVLKQFVEAGKYQEALDYFGFEGTYDPERHKSKNYDAKDYYGCTNSTSGDIYWGNLAFDNYGTLLCTYMKELYTSRNVKTGQVAQLPTDFRGLGCDMYLEEINGYIYAYKKQGLYGHCNKALIFGGIEHYQRGLSMLNLGSSNPMTIPSYPQRFKFMYKMPRKW